MQQTLNKNLKQTHLKNDSKDIYNQQKRKYLIPLSYWLA